jgi:hypothetical protein
VRQALITRNEQASGSSPRVGSLFSCDLQGKPRIQRGLGAKGEVNLLQPAAKAHRGRGLGRAMGGLLHLTQGVPEPHAAPSICAFLCRSQRPLIPLAAYVGEASSPSRAYATACSNVIIRPRSRASSKAASPRTARASSTASSPTEGSGL